MIESPSGRASEKAPRWDLTGTEGCGGANRVLVVLSDVFGVYEYIHEEEVGRWSYEGLTRVGARLAPLGALLPRGFLAAFLTSTPSLLDCICSKNDPHEGFIPFGFPLISPFCQTLK